MPKQRQIDSEYFSENLARLMHENGLNDSRLAYLLNVKRQAVHRWRQGTNSPSEKNLAGLCIALQTTRETLLGWPLATSPMLTINAWAKREGIPVPRAKALFELRLLVGEKRTDYTILVPEKLQAPEHSKSLVTLAKVRPRWVPTFHANFGRLLRRSGLSERAVSDLLGVKHMAVRHWLDCRNYPTRDRLPKIAAALKTSVQELAGHV